MATKIIDVEIHFQAREEIRLHLEVNEADGLITAAQMRGIGCLATLRMMAEWRPKLKGAKLMELPLPTGSSHSAIMLREVLRKAQGNWDFPYKEAELCHCRVVSTAKVDSAIVGGCHTVDEIRRATSANTSCGACRPDIESIIKYRLAENT